MRGLGLLLPGGSAWNMSTRHQAESERPGPATACPLQPDGQAWNMSTCTREERVTATAWQHQHNTGSQDSQSVCNQDTLLRSCLPQSVMVSQGTRLPASYLLYQPHALLI